MDGSIGEDAGAEVCKYVVVEVASVLGCWGEGTFRDAVERVGVEVFE